MLKFKQFIKEMFILLEYTIDSDTRKKDNDSFRVKSSGTGLHLSDDNGEKYGNDSLLVDNKNKKVHIVPSNPLSSIFGHRHDISLRDYANPVQKSWNRELEDRKKSKEVPVLSFGSEIPHHKIKKILKKLSSLHDMGGHTIHGDDRFEGKTVNDVIREKTPHEKLLSGEPITVYHGTSSKKYEQIKREGLNPGKRSEGEQYGDLVRGYSGNNIYFSTDPSEASNYATREAINDGSKATIVKTTIHPKDFHKIVPDEDFAHSRGLSPKLMNSFHKLHPATKVSEDHPDYDWRFPNQSFKDLISDGFDKPKWTANLDKSKIPEGMSEEDYRRKVGKDFLHHIVLNSVNLNRNSSFGFRGNVNPKAIEHHKSWDLSRIKGIDGRDSSMHNIDPDTGKSYKSDTEESVEKMRKSVKDHEEVV